jgi:hypothetical protein
LIVIVVGIFILLHIFIVDGNGGIVIFYMHFGDIVNWYVIISWVVLRGLRKSFVGLAVHKNKYINGVKIMV